MRPDDDNDDRVVGLRHEAGAVDLEGRWQGAVPVVAAPGLRELPCVPLRGQAAAQNVQRAVNVIDRFHIAKQAFFGKATGDDMIQKRG